MCSSTTKSWGKSSVYNNILRVPVPGDLACGSISPDPALFLLGALAGPCNPAVGAGPGDGEWIKQVGYNPLGK